MREQRCIALAVAQRRDLDDDLGQPVVEVLAKAPGDDLILEALVRRADDAHVDRDLLPAADPLDDALLQEAQELDLQRDRQVADLVQEQRAAVGGLDLADRLLRRTGVRALLVAEELAFEKVLGDRRAVDRDEAPALARRKVVQRAREQLLAGPRLAEDQHRRGGRRDLLDGPADPLHLRVARDDAGHRRRLLRDHAAAGSPPAARGRGTRGRSSR